MELGKDYEKQAGTGLLIAGWIFALLGGLIGVAIGAHLALGKVKSEDGAKFKTFNSASRKQGVVILIIGIISMIIWRFAVAEM